MTRIITPGGNTQPDTGAPDIESVIRALWSAVHIVEDQAQSDEEKWELFGHVVSLLGFFSGTSETNNQASLKSIHAVLDNFSGEAQEDKMSNLALLTGQLCAANFLPQSMEMAALKMGIQVRNDEDDDDTFSDPTG